MKINEIFYSIQGEGHYSGTPAIFIRFSGCNLACSFCDTLHEEGRKYALGDLLTAISHYPSRNIVLTGGEPTLQLTREIIVALHHEGYFLMLETNGTREIPADWAIDWICCSPKSPNIRLSHPDELKVLYDGIADPSQWLDVKAKVHSLQPCLTGDAAHDSDITAKTVAYVKAHPGDWRLSLQTHKYIGIR